MPQLDFDVRSIMILLVVALGLITAFINGRAFFRCPQGWRWIKLGTGLASAFWALFYVVLLVRGPDGMMVYALPLILFTQTVLFLAAFYAHRTRSIKRC